MSSDVSRETGHDESPEHQDILKETPQNIFDRHTRTVRPMIVEYRECGCVTWREEE